VNSTTPSDKALFRLAFTLVVCTLVLIVWGGHVNTTRSGMAFPDWPTSNSVSMLSYAPSEWLWQSDRFWEHGHRLLATVVGAITVLVGIGVYRRTPAEHRPTKGIRIALGLVLAGILSTVVTAIVGFQSMPIGFMEAFMVALAVYVVVMLFRAMSSPTNARLLWLSLAAFGAVCLQGMFGGYTVLHNLPDWTSTTHGMLAELFFITTIGISLLLSPSWNSSAKRTAAPRSIRVLTTLVWAFVIVQFFFGALTRHTDAWGVSVSFPMWSEGQFLPQDHLWQYATVVIHFMHRSFAYLVALAVMALLFAVMTNRKAVPKIVSTAVALAALVVLQIALGVGILWTARGELTTTLHVFGGVVMIALSTITMLNANRHYVFHVATEAARTSTIREGGVGVRT